MTTKKLVIQSFFQGRFSKIILMILFTWRVVKLHVYFLIPTISESKLSIILYDTNTMYLWHRTY